MINLPYPSAPICEICGKEFLATLAVPTFRAFRASSWPTPCPPCLRGEICLPESGDEQFRRDFAVPHEHGQRIEHAEGWQRVVPGEHVGDRVVVVAQERAGVFPTALDVDAVLESLEEIAQGMKPAAGTVFELE